jgi:hypothetical protein
VDDSKSRDDLDTTAVLDALYRVLGTNRGRQLAERLARENRSITIILNTEGRNQAPKNEPDKIYINTDPEKDRLVPVQGRDPITFAPTDEWEKPSYERKLAHELGHNIDGAEDLLNQLDPNQNFRKNENPIVQQLGEKPRRFY